MTFFLSKTFIIQPKLERHPLDWSRFLYSFCVAIRYNKLKMRNEYLHGSCFFIGSGEGPSFFTCLSRVTGGPLTVNCVRSCTSDTTGLYVSTLYRASSLNCRSVAELIQAIQNDQQTLYLVWSGAVGTGLPAFFAAYRELDGPRVIFRIIRMLLTFVLSVTAIDITPAMKSFIFTMTQLHDLVVTSGGRLVLRMDCVNNERRKLPASISEGKRGATDFICRTLYQLFVNHEEADNIQMSTVLSILKRQNLPSEEYELLHSLFCSKKVSWREVAESSYITAYPDMPEIYFVPRAADPSEEYERAVAHKSSDTHCSATDAALIKSALKSYSSVFAYIDTPFYSTLWFSAIFCPWKHLTHSLVLSYSPIDVSAKLKEVLILALKCGDYAVIANLSWVFKQHRLDLTDIMLAVVTSNSSANAGEHANFEMTEDYAASLWSTAVYGYTALMFAVIARRQDIVECILPNEVHMSNDRGDTALTIAEKLRLRSICSILKQYVLTFDANGNTPLHNLVQETSEDDESIEILRQNIFLARIPNRDNCYAIFLAYKASKYKVLSILSQPEGRILQSVSITHDGMSFSRFSILQIAVLQEDIDAVRALKQYGHSVATSRGYTALMFAAEKGYTEIVRELAPLEAQKVNAEGQTALMLAIRAGHTAIVSDLVALETEICDNKDWSPLEQAVRRGNVGMVNIIAPYEAKAFGKNALDAVKSSAFVKQADADAIREAIRREM